MRLTRGQLNNSVIQIRNETLQNMGSQHRMDQGYLIQITADTKSTAGYNQTQQGDSSTPVSYSPTICDMQGRRPQHSIVCINWFIKKVKSYLHKSDVLQTVKTIAGRHVTGDLTPRVNAVTSLHVVVPDAFRHTFDVLNGNRFCSDSPLNISKPRFDRQEPEMHETPFWSWETNNIRLARANSVMI